MCVLNKFCGLFYVKNVEMYNFLNKVWKSIKL